ncbi:MAG: hypothetical protein DMG56_09875 [Acidobacteria bacterium]|nr:MAG: hypothetical protein DMG56_09875 [Acidobacteriota bacterium]
MGSDLNRYFSRMGVRVKVFEDVPAAGRGNLAGSREEAPRMVLDIRRDKIGEFFEIRTAPGGLQEVVVLNVQPREKHLLLLSRQFDEQGRFLAKQKFLCGHDERHWFVAAIPENEPVTTVASAKIALKPEEVRTREGLLGISRKASFRRRNSAFIRQGEWFFVPTAVKADPLLVLKDEPLSRGNGGKPHWAEDGYRSGGDTRHRLCLSEISERIDRSGIQEVASERAQSGFPHHEARCSGLRAREGVASRSRNRDAHWLAPCTDEHRESLERNAFSSVSRLTAGACRLEKGAKPSGKED